MSDTFLKAGPPRTGREPARPLLAGYPRLAASLAQAERNGLFAAERRRLDAGRLASYLQDRDGRGA